MSEAKFEPGEGGLHKLKSQRLPLTRILSPQAGRGKESSIATDHE
jgi:hypothetical protein